MRARCSICKGRGYYNGVGPPGKSIKIKCICDKTEREEIIDLIAATLLKIMHNEYNEGQKLAKDDARLILKSLEAAGFNLSNKNLRK